MILSGFINCEASTKYLRHILKIKIPHKHCVQIFFNKANLPCTHYIPSLTYQEDATL